MHVINCVFLRLFEYRDNVASTSSLFISNATSHGFESRDATSTLFQSRIPYAHPPSPAASHRSDSYLLMRSPSLPSIKLFMEDPHARFLYVRASHKSVCHTHVSLLEKIQFRRKVCGNATHHAIQGPDPPLIHTLDKAAGQVQELLLSISRKERNLTPVHRFRSRLIVSHMS